MARKSYAAMAKERQRVLEVLQRHGGALSYQEISDLYAQTAGRAIAYVTLRTRLNELVASGLIAREPKHRTPRYWATRPTTDRELAPTDQQRAASPAPADADQGSSSLPELLGIPLSPDARRARAILARPAAARTPCTYAFDFLAAYLPNTSAYLPADVRAALAAIGRTAADGQPAGTYARDIMERLVIDLAWSSSRLEGNRYTRIDTEELIRSGHEASGASAVDRQMILNHKAAIEFLVENAEDIRCNRHTILSLHALLSENLLPDREQEGRLRRTGVMIGTSVYTPTAIPQIIEEQFALVLDKAAAIADPLEQAFFAMVHLPYLQPFVDVNKRTSRLAANIPLIRANLCPLSFVDVPEALYTQGILAVYELQDVALLRDVFVWAYQRSCQQFLVLREAMGDPDPIRLQYRTALREVVRRVVQSHGAWHDTALMALGAEHAVPPADQAAFARQARLDLLDLRQEVLARYQLRPSEFESWRAAATLQRVAAERSV
ncbi:MAG: Fic family protein [Gemmatimonadaceae bacterium]